MSETNPYKPPVSPAAAAGAGGFIAGGRAVDAGRGWEWIASGFALFKKQPGMWILIVIVWFVCAFLLALVPLLGGLANMLLSPVIAAGLMLGCRALERDEEFDIGYLIAGFKQNTSNLVMLGVLMLVAMIVIIVAAVLIVGGAGFLAGASGDLAGFAALGMTLLLVVLVIIAVSIPVYMAIWFAPALVILHELKPVEALKMSFFACLRNIVPFLLYGVILLVLTVIAAIPFGLGLLILMPVVIASVYTAYRDIFFAN